MHPDLATIVRLRYTVSAVLRVLALGYVRTQITNQFFA